LNLHQERDIQTHAIIGAAMEVHGILGNGFLEAVYQEALAIEFLKRGIPCAQQVELPVLYKENKLQCTYRVDFICFNEIIVELKALAVLGASEQSQVLNYLKASGKRRGLLLNFGSQSLQYKRIVL
jgi:GxxExxY protein